MKQLYTLLFAITFAVGLLLAGNGITNYEVYDSSTTATYTIPYEYALVALRLDSLDGTSQVHWKIGDNPNSLSILKADTGVVYTKFTDTTGGTVNLPIKEFHWTPYVQMIFGAYGSTVAQDSATQVNSRVGFIKSIL